MSSFADSFSEDVDDSRPADSNRPFDDDGYIGYYPRLPSQRFDAFSNFTDNESVKESADESSPVFKNPSYGSGDDVFTSQPIPETPSPPSIHATGSGFSSNQQELSSLSPESNGKAFEEDYVVSDGPMLPSPTEMQSEEGFALREWRRQNAILLEEKEKREKELLNQIIDEADEYKIEFYRRRKITIETNRSTNKEKAKLFLANQEKFHAEADKNYWKAIAELVPYEVPAIEKKRVKKDQERKTSIVVIQGPKPGKPTDLSRMRQILVKLKHNPPPDMKTSPPPAPVPTKDGKTGSAAIVAPPKAATVATSGEAVAVA